MSLKAEDANKYAIFLTFHLLQVLQTLWQTLVSVEHYTADTGLCYHSLSA